MHSLLVREINWMETKKIKPTKTNIQTSLLVREINWMETNNELIWSLDKDEFSLLVREINWMETTSGVPAKVKVKTLPTR